MKLIFNIHNNFYPFQMFYAEEDKSEDESETRKFTKSADGILVIGSEGLVNNVLLLSQGWLTQFGLLKF